MTGVPGQRSSRVRRTNRKGSGNAATITSKRRFPYFEPYTVRSRRASASGEVKRATSTYSISILTRNDHSVCSTARMPEATAVEPGAPGWPGRRMRTDGRSGAGRAAAAAPIPAPTRSVASDHASRCRPQRTGRQSSTATRRQPYDQGPVVAPRRTSTTASNSRAACERARPWRRAARSACPSLQTRDRRCRGAPTGGRRQTP